MYFDESNNYFDYYDIEKIKSNINKFDISVDNINFNRNAKLYTVENGFNKGNMFENIYSKYKNNVYKLSVNNKKDELLYKIQMYNFALKDIILYLDTHPTDQSMLNEYIKYKNILADSISKYETIYGSLMSSNVENDKSWTWINNPWPWDKGGNK